MASYLIAGRYTPDALRGMAENREDRTEALSTGLAAFGGRMDRYFTTLGGFEFFIVAELPDNVSVLAFSTVVVRSGTVEDFKVTPLVPMAMMPAVYDVANRATAEYRPAGVSKIVP